MIKKLSDAIKSFFCKLKDKICSIDKKKLAIYAAIEIIYLLWLGLCYFGGVLIGKRLLKLMAGKPEDK